MNYPAPYIHMAKMATDEGISFQEALKQFADRAREYSNEVTTDASGSRRRFQLQALGMISSALVGVAGGALLGGILGGSKGAKIGGLFGLAGGMMANGVGQLAGYAKDPRSKKEQMDYTNSDEGIANELLIPGVAGYQRGRVERHVYDAMNKEFGNKRVI